VFLNFQNIGIKSIPPSRKNSDDSENRKMLEKLKNKQNEKIIDFSNYAARLWFCQCTIRDINWKM
jgi:hypothetical protein